MKIPVIVFEYLVLNRPRHFLADAGKKLVTVGEVTGSVKGESIIKFFNGSEKTLWKGS